MTIAASTATARFYTSSRPGHNAQDPSNRATDNGIKRGTDDGSRDESDVVWSDSNLARKGDSLHDTSKAEIADAPKKKLRTLKGLISDLLFPKPKPHRNAVSTPPPKLAPPNLADEHARIKLLVEMTPLKETAEKTLDEAKKAWITETLPEELIPVEPPVAEPAPKEVSNRVGLRNRKGEPSWKAATTWDRLLRMKGHSPISLGYKHPKSPLGSKKETRQPTVLSSGVEDSTRRIPDGPGLVRRIYYDGLQSKPSSLQSKLPVKLWAAPLTLSRTDKSLLKAHKSLPSLLAKGVSSNQRFSRPWFAEVSRPPFSPFQLASSPQESQKLSPMTVKNPKAKRPLSPMRGELAKRPGPFYLPPAIPETRKPVISSSVVKSTEKYGHFYLAASSKESHGVARYKPDGSVDKSFVPPMIKNPGQEGVGLAIPRNENYRYAGPEQRLVKLSLGARPESPGRDHRQILLTEARPEPAASDGLPSSSPVSKDSGQEVAKPVNEGEASHPVSSNEQGPAPTESSKPVVNSQEAKSTELGAVRKHQHDKPRFHLKGDKPAKGAESDVSIFLQLFPIKKRGPAQGRDSKRRPALPEYINEAGVDMFKTSAEPKKDEVESPKPSTGDTVFVSLRNEVRNWIPEKQRSDIIAPEPGEYGSHSTVVVLSGVSSTLLDTDFYRLGYRAQSRDGWVTGLLKVAQARDPISHEPLGQYFVFFHSKPAALAYMNEVKRLYEVSRKLLYPPEASKSRGPLHKAVAAPQPVVSEEEEAAVRSFSLLPPSAELNLGSRIWSTFLMRELATKLGMRNMAQGLKLDPAPPGKVLVKLDGSGLSVDDVWQALRDDGRERNAPWQLVNLRDGIKPVKKLDIPGAKKARRRMADERVAAEQKNERFARFILTFTSPVHARRFVRNWHKRTIDDRELNREIVVDATVLW